MQLPIAFKIQIIGFTDAESPEVDRFTVQLKKDENGLGITIAGKLNPGPYKIILLYFKTKIIFIIKSLSFLL